MLQANEAQRQQTLTTVAFLNGENCDGGRIDIIIFKIAMFFDLLAARSGGWSW